MLLSRPPLFFERIASFLSLASVCQYGVNFLSALKPCGGLVEVFGWRLHIFHRCFFTEVLNNLSPVSGRNLPFLLRTHFPVLSANCYFSCFQYFFNNFLECCRVFVAAQTLSSTET